MACRHRGGNWESSRNNWQKRGNRGRLTFFAANAVSTRSRRRRREASVAGSMA